jgi:hypothetical protein
MATIQTVLGSVVAIKSFIPVTSCLGDNETLD